MSKIAVVYYSGTGNTEAMANAVAEGANKAGGHADLFQSSDFHAENAADFDAIAFGCPAMGDEELEETEFLPMFEECKGVLGEKKIGLFGSYGWGDGEWMRKWEDDCRKAEMNLAGGSVICCEAPDEEAENDCRKLGAALI